MDMKTTLSTLSALALLCQASAATFVTSAEATGSATGGYSVVFQSSGATSIAALGVYNSGATGTLSDTLTVTLFNFTGSAVASATVTGSGDGSIGSFVYNNLPSPVTLVAGNYYTLAVSGFTATTPYNNVTSATFDGSLIGGSGYGGGDSFTSGVPTNYTPGSAFAAGNFSTTAVSPVPEPETYAMLAGLGLVGFGLYRRCRK